MKRFELFIPAEISAIMTAIEVTISIPISSVKLSQKTTEILYCLREEMAQEFRRTERLKEL